MNPDLVPAFIFQMDILHYVCMAVGEVENSDRRPITSGDEFKAIGGEEGVETAKLVLIEIIFYTQTRHTTFALWLNGSADIFSLVSSSSWF